MQCVCNTPLSPLPATPLYMRRRAAENVVKAERRRRAAAAAAEARLRHIFAQRRKANAARAAQKAAVQRRVEQAQVGAQALFGHKLIIHNVV